MAPNASASPQDDPYTLGRDYTASARLALLHLLIHAQFGYLLHPTITNALPKKAVETEGEGLRIADIGTGTGIWVGELSRELPELPPSTHFDGFDISDAQYPPQDWYGPNTTLQKLDIFKPLPKHLAGKYDVVHLRFFMTVAKDSDIGVLLTNLKAMLKPGGYLQWVERDWLSKFPKAASETDSPHTQLTAYMNQSFNETEWITCLPKHFKSAGLEVLEHIHESPLPIYRKPWNEDNLIGNEAFSNSIAEAEKQAWFKKMLARCAAEVAKGWYVDWELHIVVGRKAVDA